MDILGHALAFVRLVIRYIQARAGLKVRRRDLKKRHSLAPEASDYNVAPS